jgi:cobaltochelatase CobS
MNAPDRPASQHPQLGLYTRSTGATAEWWRVSLSERPDMYRIEHGRADHSVDIDTVVDRRTWTQSC